MRPETHLAGTAGSRLADLPGVLKRQFPIDASSPTRDDKNSCPVRTAGDDVRPARAGWVRWLRQFDMLSRLSPTLRQAKQHSQDDHILSCCGCRPCLTARQAGWQARSLAHQVPTTSWAIHTQLGRSVRRPRIRVGKGIVNLDA